MKKESKPPELTPEQIAEMRKGRILSDAEAIKGGAEIDAEGKISLTEEQKREVKTEMEKKLAEKRSELPKHGKKNWKELVEVLSRFNLEAGRYGQFDIRAAVSGDKVVIKSSEYHQYVRGHNAEKIYETEREVYDGDLEVIRRDLVRSIDELKNKISGTKIEGRGSVAEEELRGMFKSILEKALPESEKDKKDKKKQNDLKRREWVDMLKKEEEALEFLDAEIAARKNRKGSEKTPFDGG